MIVTARRACAILYRLLRSRGDRRPFLLPANVCPIVPVTFLEAGQPFELVDVAEPHLEIDPEACERLVRAAPGRYGGMLFVRPYGGERDRDAFFAALKGLQPDLFLIDDRCLCPPHGAGAPVSPIADATLYSTGPRKHLDLGGGGHAFLTTAVPWQSARDDYSPAALAEVTERCRRVVAAKIPFGRPCTGWLDLGAPSGNWDETRSAIAAALPALDGHKRALNAIYATALPSEIQLPAAQQAWRFNIRVPAPERLVAAMFAAGLFASRHYAPLVGAFGEGDFPVATRLHAEVVNLFNDRAFDEAKALRAVDVVRRHLVRRHPPPGPICETSPAT